MTKIKLLILSILLAALPYSVMATGERLKVGDTKTKDAPSSPDSYKYPKLARVKWTYSGPIRIIMGGGPYDKSATIEARGVGKATLTCDAYYENPNGDIFDYDKHVSKSWDFECYDDDDDDNNGGGGSDPTPDGAYKAENYYTLISSEGILMRYHLTTAMNQQESRWYVGIESESGAAINTETSGSVTIPEFVPDTKNCKVIMTSPYREYTLSEGLCVSYIGADAFEKCKSLTEIIIPATVTSIGAGAFWGCTGLQTIKVYAQKPPKIEFGSAIPSYIYTNAKLIVPKGYKSAYQTALYWSNFGDNIHEEGEGTLNDGDVLTEKTSEGVEMKFQVLSASQKTCSVYGDYSVQYSPSYSVSFKASCIDKAYSGSITIPETVKGFKVIYIAGAAFAECKVSSVTIPSSVSIIRPFAFAKCSNLTSISIPNSVEYINNDAFRECTSLKSVKLSNTLKTLRTNVFCKCSSLNSVTIPSSVTEIENAAFQDCSSLTSIIIPSSVTSIGSNAFYYCSSLSSIIVDSNNKTYDSRNNCNAIIEKATNKLITGCMNTVIPSTVTSIESDAFCGHQNLSSITLPKSITAIGGWAFYNCRGLKTVNSQIETPFAIEDNVFQTWDKTNKAYLSPTATLYVPKGTKSKYQQTAGWKNFKTIKEIDTAYKGDLNGDGQTNGTDLVALSNIIIGKKSKTDSADVNNDGQVNGTDYVALVNIILGKK